MEGIGRNGAKVPKRRGEVGEGMGGCVCTPVNDSLRHQWGDLYWKMGTGEDTEDLV